MVPSDTASSGRSTPRPEQLAADLTASRPDTRSDGSPDKECSARATNPSVLFVCIHNAGRSQMAGRSQLAAGYLTHLAGDEPAGQGIDAVRPIRDAIERRVRALLDQLYAATLGAETGRW